MVPTCMSLLNLYEDDLRKKLNEGKAVARPIYKMRQAAHLCGHIRSCRNREELHVIVKGVLKGNNALFVKFYFERVR